MAGPHKHDISGKINPEISVENEYRQNLVYYFKVEKQEFISKQSEVAIVFLLINTPLDYMKASLNSALIVTSEIDIIVGYTDSNDIKDLPKDSRIKFLDLGFSDTYLTYTPRQTYVPFTEPEFFELVQLKWQLLQTCIEQGYLFIVYSDLDVVWLRNPIPTLIQYFKYNIDVHVQVQDFTLDLSNPQLCMGFIALRNSIVSRTFLAKCQDRHQLELEKNKFYGDDNALTDIYKELNQPKWIEKLPSTTFPVGNLALLYSNRSRFPGQLPHKPFIFHANFAVGEVMKTVLLRSVSTNQETFLLPLGTRLRISILFQFIRFKALIGKILRTIKH